jgi:hypothetical protein
MDRACSTNGRMYIGFRWKIQEEGRPLRRRFEGNIKMNNTEIRWSGTDCIHLSQDRDQWNTVMNLQVP